MKALIRGNEKLTKEDADSAGYSWIDWVTGAPLTNKYWAGGAYTLVEDYVAPVEGEESVITTQTDSEPMETAEAETEDKIVTINGTEYKKSELLDLLNSL